MATAIIVAFIEYLISAFVLSYVAQLSNKYKYIWIFMSTGIYLFDAHFIVFSYLYNIPLFSLEGMVLVVSGTSLMVGSFFLYRHKELWYVEEDIEMKSSSKKVSHW
ncbi:MAG: hypothetical protein HYW26_05260 [Candidatus Aenigmarchaeota archaeon]|nr:hypothetical protein [Candidatus Aenigmarchaeota archaeon]